jgi:choline kinase
MTVLILSNTANVEYYQLLENCVNSIGNHDIVVVETNSKLKGKDIPLKSKCDFIFPEEEFNYNRFLNIGISHIKDDKFIISNNDVVYHGNSVYQLSTALNDYNSVSPRDYNNKKHDLALINNNIEGYEIGNHITGCCIGLTRKTYETIGNFDESFKFWYQDNDYANLLKKYNLKHALITDALITHAGFQSHKLLGNKLTDMTHGLESTYKQKWFE